MKTSVHINASILSAILSAILVTPQALAQATTSVVRQPNNTTTDTGSSGINPMTGRPLSEEDLNRQLNKSKLVTQIGQEQVKQAQNAADLALANLRAESEKTRAHAESLAQLAAISGAKSAGVTMNRPMPLPRGNANTSTDQFPNSASTGSQPPAWGQATSVLQPVAKASGTIRIGDETLDVSTSAPLASPAQVQWVDSQARQVMRAGAPLQPINVQPATGVLGIPAIPGIMPEMMSGGQSQ